MLRGKSLIDNIHFSRVAPGRVAAWWLGQHGFVFKTCAGAMYVDAFLSDLPDRLVPPLLRPEEITNARWVVGTHDHGDHIDRNAWPAIAAASPRATFLVPDLLLPRLADELRLPRERFIGLDDGVSVTPVPGLTVHAVASAHEFLDRDGASGKYPYLGVVVNASGCVFYHSGDCCVYEGLVTKLRALSPRAMFLPINGRDARRLRANCIGNMTYQEAADLAGAVGCKIVVPGHYDMFAFNPGPVADFMEYVAVKYPAMKAIKPEQGECFEI